MAFAPAVYNNMIVHASSLLAFSHSVYKTILLAAAASTPGGQRKAALRALAFLPL
jgi:hypothetical protein